MEMSDEDFDTIPDFQSKFPTFTQNVIRLMYFFFWFHSNASLILDKSVDDLQTSNMESRSEALLGAPPPNFGSPDCTKRQNPFRSNAQDMLHSLQPPPSHQMLLHSNLAMPPRPGGPRPLLDIPTGFNNNVRPPPFLGHHHNGPPLMPDLESPSNQAQTPPFLLNNPRGLSPHVVNQTHSPQMNYRNNNQQSMRGNSPYFRNQKGPMRGGGYRPNFRGGGNRNW